MFVLYVYIDLPYYIYCTVVALVTLDIPTYCVRVIFEFHLVPPERLNIQVV